MPAADHTDRNENDSTGMRMLGPRLRGIRQERGWTLAETAAAAGVTKGFLSLAERGRTRVSVPTLLRICEALETQLGSLFEYPDDTETVVHGGTVLEMGGEGIAEFLLTPSSERHVQVMRTVLQPGGGSGGAYSLPAETIFALSVRGRLELVVDGERRLLEAGDSTTFSARSVHEWSNPGATVTEVVWAIAPPLPHAALFTARGDNSVSHKES